ncbi:MAG: DUF1801 domain-containing protein [Eubacteriales bacterium]|jgi:uncharacterized protein YdhG (YjbR/CyaY superfamily)|nr:DUF1801 domain-containing protein [Eubacteriales bacterium]
MTHTPPTPITSYILQFPPETQQKLNDLRDAILEVVPEATEKIAYGIPTFFLNGNLVHFAGYKHHIGFYPGADGIEAFAAEMGAYHFSKGAVQFPLDQPLPLELVKRITAYRKEQNLAKKK